LHIDTASFDSLSVRCWSGMIGKRMHVRSNSDYSSVSEAIFFFVISRWAAPDFLHNMAEWGGGPISVLSWANFQSLAEHVRVLPS
jgi:hypothetical protein